MKNWNDKLLTVDDLNEGDSVVYVPRHKQANVTHEDCEPGVVKSKNDTYVFVRFYAGSELKENAQACKPEDLKHRL